MKDPDDIVAYKKSIEKTRIHIFLNGLDAEFEQVRGEILRMEKRLDLEHTNAYVRREATRRILLNGDSPNSDLVAMLARRPPPSNRRNSNSAAHPTSTPTARSFDIGQNFVASSGPPRTCTHCGGTGHSKSRCYDIIGYPEWWDPTRLQQSVPPSSPPPPLLPLSLLNPQQPLRLPCIYLVLQVSLSTIQLLLGLVLGLLILAQLIIWPLTQLYFPF